MLNSLTLKIHRADNPNITRLVAVENKPKEHHLVVCTLCSCYPTGVSLDFLLPFTITISLSPLTKDIYWVSLLHGTGVAATGRGQ